MLEVSVCARSRESHGRESYTLTPISLRVLEREHGSSVQDEQTPVSPEFTALGSFLLPFCIPDPRHTTPLTKLYSLQCLLFSFSSLKHVLSN